MLVCNHVSFVDALVIMAASPRPIRFVMDHRIFKTPVARLALPHAKAIPIAPAQEDAAMLDEAYERIAQALAAGELVCIFPEGRSPTPASSIRSGPACARSSQRTPVPVIPMALRGLWGSCVLAPATARPRPAHGVMSRLSAASASRSAGGCAPDAAADRCRAARRAAGKRGGDRR